MPITASCLLVLGLFGIVWLALAWRSHLPLLSHPAVAPTVPRPRLLKRGHFLIARPAARQLHTQTSMFLSAPPSVPGERSKAGGEPRNA